MRFRPALAAALVAALLSCGREKPAPAAPAAPNAPAAAPVPVKKQSRLPEDPIAGKRSYEQWRAHQAHEKDERDLAFDHFRLGQHRAVVRMIDATRARYDRARTEAAVTKVKSSLGPRIAEVRSRVKAIDPWGNRSRLLEDFAALAASLEGAYADARIAAIKGDAQAQENARTDFDQRMKRIADWLVRVEREGEGEGEEGEYEGEREREREEASEREREGM